MLQRPIPPQTPGFHDNKQMIVPTRCLSPTNGVQSARRAVPLRRKGFHGGLSVRSPLCLAGRKGSTTFPTAGYFRPYKFSSASSLTEARLP